MPRAVPLLLLTAALTAGCAAGNGDAAAPSAPGGESAMPAPASSGPGSAAAAPAGRPPGAGSGDRTVRGTFTGYTVGAIAITYDAALVPLGSSAALTVDPTGRGVSVRLAASRLLPRRRYGAHLHTSVCGPSADQAGPHYQNAPDPAAVASPPSVDPSYANPVNEVWLDFTTDAAGSGTATTTQPWPFDGINPPRSLVLHAGPTDTRPGRAGVAGPRIACLTLPG